MELAYDDFDDDDFEDGPLEHFDDDDAPVALGACCACGAETDTVRNILMLQFCAPVAGTGWACFVCGLPADGALAVVCDVCIEDGNLIDNLRFVISGLAGDKGRVDIRAIEKIHFDHDLAKHPELDQ